MLAWHCEPELKAKALDRLREHRRLDEITQGIYWKNGRGCNLGCLTHVGSSADVHEEASRMFGLPLTVCYWLEAVFEGLPEDRCADWVVNSAAAIPVGADLSLIHHVFCAWLLRDSGLLTIVNRNRDAIARVVALHDLAASGREVSEHDWSSAESSAESSAASAAESAESAASAAESSAAWSAARSAWSAVRSAWSAAWSAAESAESAAESAAWSAAWSAAESAAWSAAWIKIADKSLEVFAAAPVKRCDEFSPELYCAATYRVPVLV